MRKLILVAAAALSLSACATPAPINLTSTTPQEVSTFAGVELSAAAVIRAATVYVQTVHTTPEQRATMRKAVLAVQAEANRLRDARDHNRSLSFDVFNQAVRAFFAARDGSSQP